MVDDLPSMAGAAPGVAYVYNQNHALANIGTPQQYSRYVKSIFPDSDIREIVYRGTADSYDEAEGYTFTREQESSETAAVLNAQDNVAKNQEAKEGEFNFSESPEGITVYNDAQIHTLGSQLDLEGFQNWMELNTGTIEGLSEEDILNLPECF